MRLENLFFQESPGQDGSNGVFQTRYTQKFKTHTVKQTCSIKSQYTTFTQMLKNTVFKLQRQTNSKNCDIETDMEICWELCGGNRNAPDPFNKNFGSVVDKFPRPIYPHSAIVFGCLNVNNINIGHKTTVRGKEELHLFIRAANFKIEDYINFFFLQFSHC